MEDTNSKGPLILRANISEWFIPFALQRQQIHVYATGKTYGINNKATQGKHYVNHICTWISEAG